MLQSAVADLHHAVGDDSRDDGQHSQQGQVGQMMRHGRAALNLQRSNIHVILRMQQKFNSTCQKQQIW